MLRHLILNWFPNNNIESFWISCQRSKTKNSWQVWSIEMMSLQLNSYWRRNRDFIFIVSLRIHIGLKIYASKIARFFPSKIFFWGPNLWFCFHVVNSEVIIWDGGCHFDIEFAFIGWGWTVFCNTSSIIIFLFFYLDFVSSFLFFLLFETRCILQLSIVE